MVLHCSFTLNLRHNLVKSSVSARPFPL
uniref:Uncharacterized protein n=1 Tax=Anguilla anguilla TaxID=7936 RepID=A0A0E9Q568_ANGAN